MSTGCNPSRLSFQGAGRRCVEAGFDGGELTENAGALLICEYFERSSLIDGLHACFTDARDQDRVEHPLSSLLRQRMVGCQTRKSPPSCDRFKTGVRSKNDQPPVVCESPGSAVEVGRFLKSCVEDGQFPDLRGAALDDSRAGSPTRG